MSVLEVKKLTKKFRQTTAVNSISFNIKPGEIVGLLGPNGAGKSTTIEMILGLIKPTSGAIKVFGQDIEHHREEILGRVNYTSAYIRFMSRLTVRQNLKFFGVLYHVKNLNAKIDELGEQLDLTRFMKHMFYRLSSGEKTRVILAKALINDAEFLLLDEPTASLDPEVAYKVRAMLKKIHTEKGVTMLYTSHNMAEVEEMCDRIIFLQNGQIVAQGTPAALKKDLRDYYLELSFDPAQESKLIEFIEAEQWPWESRTGGHIAVKATASNLANILKQISQPDFGIYDIDVDKPNLEEVFLKLARNG